jgi:hypothetical protein
MSVHFKSLSGDIISISLSLYSDEGFLNKWDTWNRIISIIACETGCTDTQVVILEDEPNDEKESCQNPPELIIDRQYNFFIRDLEDNLSVHINSYHEEIKDVENELITYNKFSISIIYNCDSDIIFDPLLGLPFGSPNGTISFDIYEKEDRNLYYHEKDVLLTYSDDFNPISIKINNVDEGLLSIYSILCEKAYIPVPWYDRQNIIDRIMSQYNEIDEYRINYKEDWDRFAGHNIE